METRADYKTRFDSQGVGVSRKNPQIGARFPEPYHSMLEGMANKANYVRRAVVTYLNLKSHTLEILEKTNDHSKAIDEAFALLEENGLLDELNKRLD